MFFSRDTASWCRSSRAGSRSTTAIRRPLCRVFSGPSRATTERRHSGFTMVRDRRVLLSCRWLQRRDRKSTRLNSSHGYISYAVFCLKNKNIRGESLGFIGLLCVGTNAYLSTYCSIEHRIDRVIPYLARPVAHSHFDATEYPTSPTVS